MVRNCFVWPCFLAGAVFMAGVARADSIDPNQPPQGRFSDEWGEVYMSGAKVGYSHSTMAREGNLIHTGTTVVMEIARERQKLALRTEERTTETLAGVPLSFESTMDMSMMKTALRGTVKDGKVTIVQAQFGMEQTQTFDYPPGALMTWGSFRESLLRGFRPGTEYVLSIYAPQLRLDDAVTATTTVGKAEEFEHRNKRLRGQRVTVVMESPMGSMELISWMDQEGRSLKALLPVPGLGNLELITADQATALAEFVPPEVFLTTVIEAKRKIDPKSAHWIKYRIIARNGEVDLGELPATDMQTLGERTERSAEVVVTRQTHRVVGGDGGPKPHAELAEYLDGNLMINVEDPNLVELAKRAADGEAEPFALGDKLRRFVTDYVTTKSLSVGFATASEVSRTKEGDCSEHAVLLAALGRLNRLPARLVVGVVYLPRLGGRQGVFGYHMWTQFFIDGRWIDFDAALRESECSPSRIAFATSSLKNTGLADLSLPLLSKIGGIDIEILEVDRGPGAP